ncbi:hypothetical protein [Methylobacterium longum]|uniref:Uncharacterized protein n=1 Tax=Methylobacterium longum TaxID=767694 RepID=A0ABT8ASI0_9HYPH|nr:hypothetical protein [Methylobacterium longum]MDN3572371.1 hypothetical protein [Methylobacterium longum]
MQMTLALFQPPNEPEPEVEVIESKLPRLWRASAKAERASAVPESASIKEMNEPPATAPPFMGSAVSDVAAARAPISVHRAVRLLVVNP